MTTQLPAEPPTTGDPGHLRERAVKQLKKRRDLLTHVIVYLLVNGFLVMIWATSSDRGFFWPIFPIAGWGIAVLLNAWDVLHGDEFSAEAIEHEMQRLQSRH